MTIFLKRRRPGLPAFALFAASLMLSSCASPDRVLFVTNTQAGIGYDATTATGHVGLDRQDTYIGPAYPNDGGLPPVAASLQSSLDWFSPSVTQYYATGDAALLATNKIVEPLSIDRSTLAADDPRRCSLNMGCKWDGATQRRLSVVATNTHVGLVVKTASSALSALDFGYGRQEASMLALHADGDAGTDIYPSAFASIIVDTNKNSTSVPTGLAVTQFIATGSAADALASTPAARDSFGVIAQSQAAAQTKSLQQSLALSDTDVATLHAQAAQSVTATNAQAAALVQKILGPGAAADRPLTSTDRQMLVAASQKITAGDAIKNNALAIANAANIDTTGKLGSAYARHTDVLSALDAVN